MPPMRPSEPTQAGPGNPPPDLGGTTVTDLNGHEVDLASLWSERRIVLAFLRHFG